MGANCTRKGAHAVARGQPATGSHMAGRGTGPLYRQAPFQIFYFIIFLGGLLRNFLAFSKNGCTTPPFFEACPYTWNC
jgi:hypothetical protein